MKVLHVIPAFYPSISFGGPIISTHDLCNGLAEKPDIELKVVTTNTAGPGWKNNLRVDSIPMRYPAGYDVYMLQRIAGACVSTGLLRFLHPLIRWADIVHLTGAYSFPTLPTLMLARSTGTPLVWSPRGAWSRWTGSRRVLMKRAWDRLCTAMIDRKHLIVHYTSSREAETAILEYKRLRYRVIPNGVILPPLREKRPWLPDGRLRLLFIGRYNPIKGIERLLQAMQSLIGKATLRLFGDGDSQYIQQLHSLIQQAGLDGHVELNGFISDSNKEEVWQSSDVLVLPSYSENFGMVVAEALAHSVPVIVSTGTPWSSVVVEGCGWWIDNTAEDIAEAINVARKRDLPAMGSLGRAWMEREFGWERIANDTKDMYHDMLHPGK
jgi:glycosyltransferase involved in cell wall biosynthesis